MLCLQQSSAVFARTTHCTLALARPPAAKQPNYRKLPRFRQCFSPNKMASSTLFIQNNCSSTVAAGAVLCPSSEIMRTRAARAPARNSAKRRSARNLEACILSNYQCNCCGSRCCIFYVGQLHTSTFHASKLCLCRHQQHLGAIKELLLPGGQYTHNETSSRSADDISLELMIAGLDVTASTTKNGSCVFVATLPAAGAASAPLPSKAAGSAWGVVDSTADLVDEDALLAGDNADDAIKASGDCSTKPRACADCSCGRAEAEQKADAAGFTEDQLQSFTSACGNVSAFPASCLLLPPHSCASLLQHCSALIVLRAKCFKGDAFRCASCPHRGKPAFVPGMEGVMLDLNADDAEGPIAYE